MAKLTFELGEGEYYTKSTIESGGEDIYEIMELVERVLVAGGFHSETVQRGFIERAEEYLLAKAEEDDNEHANSTEG